MTSHSISSVVDLLPSSNQTNACDNNSNFDIRLKSNKYRVCQQYGNTCTRMNLFTARIVSFIVGMN